MSANIFILRMNMLQRIIYIFGTIIQKIVSSKVHVDLPVHVGGFPDHRPSERHLLLELPAVIMYPGSQV